MLKQRLWIVVGICWVAAGTPDLARGDEPDEGETINSIVVEISNVPNDEGQVGCTIFSKEDGFPAKSSKGDKQMWVQPKSKRATCTFDGLKPGVYAVSVVHDADKNGELNTSMVGRPKEWWGVSNNAAAHRFGAPKFDEAKFQYAGGRQTLKVKLQR